MLGRTFECSRNGFKHKESRPKEDCFFIVPELFQENSLSSPKQTKIPSQTVYSSTFTFSLDFYDLDSLPEIIL